LGDIAVLLAAFLLTVLVDITIAVGVGMILAAFFFLKRMSDHSPFVSAQQGKIGSHILSKDPSFLALHIA